MRSFLLVTSWRARLSIREFLERRRKREACQSIGISARHTAVAEQGVLAGFHLSAADAAARRPVESVNASEAVQDGRIYVARVNGRLFA
jgi:hypothetical protein